jgi:hypothetical protein
VMPGALQQHLQRDRQVGPVVYDEDVRHWLHDAPNTGGTGSPKV